jgi:hypothetical protein
VNIMKFGMPDKMQRRIRLDGYMPLMFDRYAGDNKTKLIPEDKLYFLPGTMNVCLPAVNLSSFLSAKNTTSVAKIIGGKQYKSLADAFLSFTMIAPAFIPILRDEKPIEFSGFKDGRDEHAKIHVEYHVARLDKGIPNPKERPVIELPWTIEFELTIFKNNTFDEKLIMTAFDQGGATLGLGTFRGMYGKFSVTKWDDV